MKSRNKGFTIIELVVVMAVIAILSAIAYSGYTDSIRRTRRVEARNVMLDIAARQERFRYSNPGYAATLAALGLGDPFITAGDFFSVSMATAGTGYTITAVPHGSNVDAKCASLTLTNTQVKGSTGTVVNNPACWE